jgi:Secretion system C-terminal sorting domain
VQIKNSLNNTSLIKGNNFKGMDFNENALKLLSNVELDLAQNGKTVLQMNVAQENVLKEIANGETPSKYPAQAMLELKNGNLIIRPTEIWPTTFNNEPIDNRSSQVQLPNNQFVIQPNPATAFLNINWSPLNLGKSATIQLIDCNGKTHFNKTVISEDSAFELNVPDLQSGIYFVRLIFSNQNFVQKVVISR